MVELAAEIVAVVAPAVELVKVEVMAAAVVPALVLEVAKEQAQGQVQELGSVAGIDLGPYLKILILFVCILLYIQVNH